MLFTCHFRNKITSRFSNPLKFVSSNKLNKSIQNEKPPKFTENLLHSLLFSADTHSFSASMVSISLFFSRSFPSPLSHIYIYIYIYLSLRRNNHRLSKTAWSCWKESEMSSASLVSFWSPNFAKATTLILSTGFTTPLDFTSSIDSSELVFPISISSFSSKKKKKKMLKTGSNYLSF